MKLTVPIKLAVSDLQAQALRDTMRIANECCDYVSHLVYETKLWGRFAIQKRFYRTLRDQFPDLNAQMIIRAVGKVAAAYVNTKHTQIRFRPEGALCYDQRILTLRDQKCYVSIATVLGRLRISYQAGPRQHELLRHYQRGECKLIQRNRKFFLHCVCDIPEAESQEPDGYLGVDLGIRNIAVTSDRTCYSGAHVTNVRRRHHRLRRKLQQKGTKSAKRLLRKRSRRERRFCRNQNHIISKKLVAQARCTNSVIVLENLKGIRRTKVRKPQRRELDSWSFDQLRRFITYKANRAGVGVTLVNPSQTSQTCPDCGYVSKRNRISQSEFCCKRCGRADHADYIAAINIANRGAAVNQPYVAA